MHVFSKFADEDAAITFDDNNNNSTALAKPTAPALPDFSQDIIKVNL